MELERPEIPFTSVDLQPDEEEAKRQTRGIAELPERLKGWLEIGIPVVKAIDVAHSESDPSIIQYLQNEKNFKFYSVHFACDFKPPKDCSFADAWFEIQLLPEPISVKKEVVAWSMNPLTEGIEQKVTKTYKLDAMIKFEPVGLGGSGERIKEFTGTEVHIEAHRLGTNKPSWEFIHTEARSIRGIYLLDLVIKQPNTIKSKIIASLTANVESYKFGIFKYHTPIQPSPNQERIVG